MVVLPLCTDNYKVPIGFYLGKQVRRIEQKIYNIVKSIFGYFSVTENFFSSAIWCCLFISVAKAIKINLTPTIHWEECTTTICNLWNNTFPPSLNVRCNTSDPRYYPFSIFEKCMQTLCQVIDDQARSLYGCQDYMGKLIVAFELSNSSTVLIDLWNQFCPKPLYIALAPKERKSFFNECFKELCNYEDHFSYSGNSLIENLCSSLTIKELENRLKNIEETLGNSSSPAEDATISMIVTGSNVGTNLITAGCTIIGLYLTIKAGVKVKKVLPSLTKGLGHMLKTTADTSLALFNMDPVSSARNEEIRETLLELSNYVDEIFSDARSHLSEESDGRSHLSEESDGRSHLSEESDGRSHLSEESDGRSHLSEESDGRSHLSEESDGRSHLSEKSQSIYQSPQNSVNNISPIHSSTLFILQIATLSFGSGTLVGGAIFKAIEFLKENNYTINSHDLVTGPPPYLLTSVTSNRTNLTNITTLTVGQNLNERLEEITTKSTWDLIDSTLKINFADSHFETTAEEYVEFLLEPYYYIDGFETEAARIEHTLEYWDNSICLYQEPNTLFCRSNFYDYIITLPNLILQTLIKSKEYLCTYIEEYGLWCDWNQFLNLAMSKIFSTRNIIVDNECPSDYVSLGIEKDEDMGITLNFTGNCYNESFYLPWE